MNSITAKDPKKKSGATKKSVVTTALRVKVGPERIILGDGLQPFMFQTKKGTLFLQAQTSPTPGFKIAATNPIPGYGHFASVVSRNHGKTWGRWLPEPWTKRLAYFEGAYTALSDGTIQMVEWIADCTSKKGIFHAILWESKDDLETIKGPIMATIDLPQAKAGGFDDHGNPYSGLCFHRTILELPGGDLLAAIYGWFEGDDTPCTYVPKVCKYRCILLRSSDRGRHWSYTSTIAVDPMVGEEGFDEPVMIRLSKGPKAGRLICLMRTGSFKGVIYQAISDDEGRSWSKPHALDLRGVDPDLIEMADGTLVCAVGWRVEYIKLPDGTHRSVDWEGAGKPPLHRGTNYLAFSRDQGKTWTQITPFQFEPHGPSLSTFYTTVCETAPGRLFVCYDIGSWGGQAVRYVAGREVEISHAES